LRSAGKLGKADFVITGDEIVAWAAWLHEREAQLSVSLRRRMITAE
jgi:hypothetical protein